MLGLILRLDFELASTGYLIKEGLGGATIA